MRTKGVYVEMTQQARAVSRSKTANPGLMRVKCPQCHHTVDVNGGSGIGLQLATHNNGAVRCSGSGTAYKDELARNPEFDKPKRQ